MKAPAIVYRLLGEYLAGEALEDLEQYGDQLTEDEMREAADAIQEMMGEAAKRVADDLLEKSMAEEGKQLIHVPAIVECSVTDDSSKVEFILNGQLPQEKRFSIICTLIETAETI